MNTITTDNAGMPLENIVHRTGLRHFSLHHTIVPLEDKSALYLHCHPEAELFYMEQGDVRFFIESQKLVLHQGDGLFIPPDLIHHAEHEPGTECKFYAIVFSTDMLEESLPPYCKEYFDALRTQKLNCIYPITDTDFNRSLRALLPQIFQYFEQDIKTCELTLFGLLLCAWQELYNLHFSVLNEKASFSPTRAEIQTAMKYIQQNYADAISLSELAAKVGLSDGHFCRSFKNFTGITPFAYLNKIRIIKSCELLSQTNKKITDIAILCGFNNISYFNRVFYRVMGVPPSEYRKSI